eukprot:TRINITY_DN14598_c0_g1_i1.p2 TRINITY_DN14598_c0_g1~~TRINITY_DN14598_c0_g1_i1.p2  ORF type:complete len:142 (+),score=10.48 TRINITY_DN14598_c0_g1_i1:638-1063(+)
MLSASTSKPRVAVEKEKAAIKKDGGEDTSSIDTNEIRPCPLFAGLPFCVTTIVLRCSRKLGSRVPPMLVPWTWGSGLTDAGRILHSTAQVIAAELQANPYVLIRDCGTMQGMHMLFCIVQTHCASYALPPYSSTMRTTHGS